MEGRKVRGGKEVDEVVIRGGKMMRKRNEGMINEEEEGMVEINDDKAKR